MEQRENGRVGEEALPGEAPGGGKKRSAVRSWLLLGALILFAGVLRAWGLTWGLPHAGRFYPYHPDESVLLHAVCRVNPLWGDFEPGFYNYGTLYIFLSRLAFDFIAPTAGWGSVPRDAPFAAWVEDFAHLLLVSRWVTVVLGAGCVLLTYHLGRTLFSHRAGWMAALFLAVAPMPVLLGHYMTVDVPATFFTTLALLLAALGLHAADRHRALTCVIAAGFVSGLAAGTKYNAGVALLSLAVPVWAVWGGDWKQRRSTAVWAAAGAMAACAAGFLLATPGALLRPDLFQKDLLYEMVRNQEGQGLIFKHTPPAALYHLFISLPVGLEWPLYLLCLAGLAWSIFRRRREDVLLLLFVVSSFALLVPAERKYVRYVVPLLPPLVILAARLLDEKAKSRERSAVRSPQSAGGAETASPNAEVRSPKSERRTPKAALHPSSFILLPFVLPALASTVAHLGVIAGPDARDRAAMYLLQHASPSDIVALGADAWYYTPPIDPTTGCAKAATLYGGPPRWDNYPAGAVRPDLCRLERFQVLAPTSFPPAGALPISKLRKYRPRFVILADEEYEDPERIHRADPSFPSGILDLEAALGEEGYRVVEFRPRPSLFGFTWWKHGIPPHDWRYYMPTVRIYERSAQ